MELPPIATLWVEGALDWMGQAALRAAMAQGHEVFLYHYGPVTDVPDGVKVRSAAQIWPCDRYHRYGRRSHLGLMADLFRPRLLASHAGVIWIDHDVILRAPLQPADGWLMAREGEGGRIGTAVLALPATSDVLAELLRRVESPEEAPKWGSLGPQALTRAVKACGAGTHLSPSADFYPVGFDDISAFHQAGDPFGPARAVHLWAGQWQGPPKAGSAVADLIAGKAVAQDHGWGAIAQELAGPDGFYRSEPEGHSFLYVPRSRATLVVTFDNLDIAMEKRADRRPWGFDFIAKQGWSMLGVMAGGWTWYRTPWVWAEFDRLRDSGFFAQFDRVVFYGASMGGYAAAAFSASCPGADVVAISPQSTLDKRLVPWETRYKTAWERDFSGPYGDAAKVCGHARQVTMIYDPYEPLDRGHADRFQGGNVVKLRAPLMGHRLGSSLAQMGILSPLILAALSGRLTQTDFYHALRARRDFPRYQRELFDRTLRRGQPKLAMLLGGAILRRREDRAIRRRLKALELSHPPPR